MMSGATLTIGLLPGYAAIGVAAPVLLVILRLIEGFAAGGEFGSAASFLAESAPRHRRGFGVSWLEVGSLLGFLAGSFVYLLLSTGLDEDQLTAWGGASPSSSRRRSASSASSSATRSRTPPSTGRSKPTTPCRAPPYGNCSAATSGICSRPRA